MKTILLSAFLLTFTGWVFSQSKIQGIYYPVYSQDCEDYCDSSYKEMQLNSGKKFLCISHNGDTISGIWEIKKDQKKSYVWLHSYRQRPKDSLITEEKNNAASGQSTVLHFRDFTGNNLDDISVTVTYDSAETKDLQPVQGKIELQRTPKTIEAFSTNEHWHVFINYEVKTQTSNYIVFNYRGHANERFLTRNGGC